MQTFRTLWVMGLTIAATALSAGCASSGGERPRAAEADDPRTEQCGFCGQVRFVQQVVRETGSAVQPAQGGLLGGVTGGVLNGPRVATRPRQVLERLTIDMDFGGVETVEIPAPSGVRRGDRVEVRGNFVTVIRDEL